MPPCRLPWDASEPVLVSRLPSPSELLDLGGRIHRRERGERKERRQKEFHHRYFQVFSALFASSAVNNLDSILSRVQLREGVVAVTATEIVAAQAESAAAVGFECA